MGIEKLGGEIAAETAKGLKRITRRAKTAVEGVVSKGRQLLKEAADDVSLLTKKRRGVPAVKHGVSWDAIDKLPLQVRRDLANHPDTPAGALVKLAQDSEPGIVLSVARHARTPKRILVKLAASDDPWVREAVALNTHTPLETVKRIANDDHPYVRKIARQALKNR